MFFKTNIRDRTRHKMTGGIMYSCLSIANISFASILVCLPV